MGTHPSNFTANFQVKMSRWTLLTLHTLVVVCMFMALCVVCAAGDSSSSSSTSSDEMVLTLASQRELTQMKNSASFAAILFVLPWSSTSQTFLPIFTSVATTLSSSDVTFAIVDAVKTPQLAKAAGVSVYPTVLFFRSGNPLGSYSGEWSESALSAFILAEVGPPVVILEAGEEDTFREEFPCAVVGYGPENSPYAWVLAQVGAALVHSKPAIRVGLVAAESAQNIQFHCSFNREEQASFEYVPREAEAAKDAVDSLLEWIRAHALPLFGPVTPSLYSLYKAQGKPLGIVFVSDSDDAEAIADVTAIVADAAQVVSARVLFGYMDAEFMTVLAPQLEGASLPALAVIDPDSSVTPHSGPITAASVAAFFGIPTHTDL